MLLKLYLGSVVFNFVVSGASLVSAYNKAKKDGYKIANKKKEKISPGKKIMGNTAALIKIIIRHSIPVISSIDAVFKLCFWEKITDKIITVADEQKIIVNPEIEKKSMGSMMADGTLLSKNKEDSHDKNISNLEKTYHKLDGKENKKLQMLQNSRNLWNEAKKDLTTDELKQLIKEFEDSIETNNEYDNDMGSYSKKPKQK